MTKTQELLRGRRTSVISDNPFKHKAWVLLGVPRDRSLYFATIKRSEAF